MISSRVLFNGKTITAIFLLSPLLILAESKELDSLYTAFIQSRVSTNYVDSFTDDTLRLDNKCGFPLIVEIKNHLTEFSLEKQKIINRLLSRPELSSSIVSPKGLFRIHFDETGIHKPGYDVEKSAVDNAELIAQVFDSVYSYEINHLEYPAPPTDIRAGGDNLYDVYIVQMPPKNYGVTNTDELIDGRLCSYIEIDNNFNSDEGYDTYHISAAQVTAAHEFFHAIQFGMVGYPTADKFYFDLSATAMEEFVFNTVNDYYYNIQSFFNNMYRTFSDTKGYDLALWNIFLQKRYGFQLLKRQWELMKENNVALNAISASLNELDLSLSNEIHEFGIWCYFTNYRAKEGKYFDEAKNYPLIRNTFTVDPPAGSYEINTQPLSNTYFTSIVRDEQSYYKDTLVALITNTDVTNAIENPSLLRSTKYSVITQNDPGYTHVANNYYSKLNGNNDYFLTSYFFNNELMNGGPYEAIAEMNYPFPSPFSYSKYAAMYIPVEYNSNREAKLYIYSPNMELKYSALTKIKIIDKKFVVEWDGMNNNKKLPTGVYLYVTEYGDKLTKGKLVIYND